MQMIEFWILRKGEDARKLPPEIGDLIAEPPPDNGECLFCHAVHEFGAVIAFCWRKPEEPIHRAIICVDCAKHDDKKLAEMTQEEVFGDSIARLLEFVALCRELEAMGLLETVRIDPVTGFATRQRTAKGREHPELWKTPDDDAPTTPERFQAAWQELIPQWRTRANWQAKPR
jgi:hypothetical protein